MTLEIVQQRDDLREFLEFLYADQTGFVYSPTKNPQEPDPAKAFKQHFFQWPQERAKLYTHIVTQTKDVDVYIAPALFNEKSSKKEHVKGTHVFWAEFDGQLPNDSALQGLPGPSLRIQSSDSAHEHWYWKLTDFIGDVEFIERVNRGLTYKLGADTSGWDADQVLRPPKTINHKHGRSVSVLAESPLIANPNDFNSLPIPPKLSTTFDSDSLLDTAWVIAKYQWPKSDFDFFRSREIPVGERSSAMMRLGYICAEVGMLDQEIFSILYSADERWGKFRGRADRIQRLNDIVTKVRIKHPLTDARIDLNNLPIYGFNSFLKTEVEIEWVIPGLLLKSGSMLLTSKPGLGKTQLSLRFAMNLALGQGFLHYEIEKPIRSAFFSLEMGHADLKFFLSRMAENLSQEQMSLLEENLMIIPLGEPLYLDSKAGQNAVEQIIGDHKIEGYFFDSLGSTTGETLTDEKVVKSITDWDARFRQKSNTFSWFIHHNRKATAQNKKPRALDDIYGNQYIAARATSAYVMWQKDGLGSDEPIDVINVKKRLAPTERPFQIIRNGETLDFQKVSATRALKSENDQENYAFSDIGVSDESEGGDDPLPPMTEPGITF